MAAKKSSRVNVKYKTKYRVRNWPEYDKALRSRGDVTVWFEEGAVATWTPSKNGRRGAQRRYSNLAILTALTLRAVFHLPLRQTEGFLNSILRLMVVDLAAPDHTTLSRRNRGVEVPRLAKNHGGPIHVIVDSTGLKVLGDGEWHRRKHKTKSRRTWRKLHIGVDAAGFIVASVLTQSTAGDAAQMPRLLDQVDSQIDRVTGDGGYDTRGVYDAIAAHQDERVRVVIPPRKGAVISGSSTHAAKLSNRNVAEIEELGRRRWKKESGHHQQGRVENTVFRYKRVLCGRLRAICAESQRREALIGCEVLNRMAELGMPESYAIG